MTDTPINPREKPPVPRSEAVKAFIGDLARPFNQYAIGGATAAAIVIGATKITDATGGAIYITAVGVIALGLFGLKSLENVKTGGQSRDVAIAQTNAGGTSPPTS